MKLFTFGCSYTRDNYQETWANIVSRDLNIDLYNLAERGAGADFVSKRVLTANISQDDLVIIMWPSADRFDLWADKYTPHLLEDYVHASWPDGDQPMLVDLQGQRRLDQGFILNGSVPRGYKHQYFKYFYSPTQVVNNWYSAIVMTQLYLRSIGVQYYMMTAFPFECPINYHLGKLTVEQEIVNKIDLTMFAETDGFYTWAKTNNKCFLNDHYPATIAHQEYVDIFLTPLMTKQKFLKK